MSVIDDDASAEWITAGDAAATAIIDIVNKRKDREDEALDAQRVHGGQTLDEFLEQSSGS